METKKQRLVSQLISHFNGDKERVKRVGNACKTLDIDLNNDNVLDSIAEHPEAFFTIISFADFGVIAKLEEAKSLLKKEN